MSLILEVEFLAGVCRAAREPSDDAPDWPPQPDRLFSALVSSWAARGERSVERAALEWLERQPPPAVHASGHTRRTAPEVFVPPNDVRSSRTAKTYIRVMPERRPRQPRRFPVAVPDDSIMALAWPEHPEPAVFDALDAIARDVAYVGHSASFARCRFVLNDMRVRNLPRTDPRRRIYPGRLEELERAHRENPVRPMISPGASVRVPSQGTPPSEHGWLVLEVIDGEVPDIRAAAPVCRLLRQALMSGYRRAGRENTIPEVVSGHASDGTPTRVAHLAIAPMAFAGFPHADGRVFGFAVIPPAGTSLSEVPGFQAAFENVAGYDYGEERRVLELADGSLPSRLRLVPADRAGKRSLSPQPYLREARIWASVTPMVLDRHLKRNDDAEIRELVASACENVGLPRPDTRHIQTGKHSAVEGVPPARPPAGGTPWTAWQVPQSMASRSLVHAIVDFEQKVHGPVLLGAGRFTGLGFFRDLGS